MAINPLIGKGRPYCLNHDYEGILCPYCRADVAETKVKQVKYLLSECEEELIWCEAHWGSDYQGLLKKIRAVLE